ncbi:hypothetical protein XM38_040420 [Halomicronema hongdechloris C2206]|uniref:ArnT-like N-terminal domain-containing protein n=1 Tax=Halomicronema hongdechloris C2206 TaxID=1641165 RepID=A0A1Z3HRZ3_9CYAN|nr:phospholipid carrier-dependent glycosyltransferase [Halomicronema hongdechloris]ASC73080.1 hypothetical protein XM38_040420 [Halomicronema hongdechloris C2206]
MLRFTNLALKPAWMDEVSTVIFSLGNSSHLVPLNQVISVEQLLRPLVPDATATVADAVQYLLQENNHPPAYFALAHLWMDWFPPVRGLASLWAARALAALLGTLSIPLAYGLGRLSFQSPLAGQLAAACMAVSPFGIYLAQEARHYTMAIALVLASLCCFVVAVGRLLMRQSIDLWLVLGWIGVNGLAFATHYFAVLTLVAEGLTLLGLLGHQSRQQGNAWRQPSWRRIYWVALGTLAMGLSWLPVLSRFYGSPQTGYLTIDLSQPFNWLKPLGQSLVTWIFMVVTPITSAYSPVGIAVMVVSILVVLALVIAILPWLVQARQRLWQTPEGRQGLIALGGFLLAMGLLFVIICYGYRADISRGYRYHFVYYPAVVALLAGLLSVYWPRRQPWAGTELPCLPGAQYIAGRRLVQGLWAVSLIGALLVVTNWAFPKFYRPDRFIPYVQQHSQYPVVFATTTIVSPHYPTVWAIEPMSLGWEFHRHFAAAAGPQAWETPPQFLVMPTGEGIETPFAEQLAVGLAPLDRPLDLWMAYYHGDLSALGCDQLGRTNKGNYRQTHYRCR